MIKPKLIRTNIGGLDERLGGGIPDRSLILVQGEAGSGFNLFAQQLLFTKLREGGNVLYFVTERAPEEILEDLSSFGWNLNFLEEEKRKNWKFVDAYSDRHQFFDKMETRSMFLKQFLPQVVPNTFSVIDSLSHLLFLYDFTSVLDMVDLYRRRIRSVGGFHFMLMGVGRHERGVVDTIAHLADGVFEFKIYEGRGRELERVLHVKKLRLAVHDLRGLPVRITPRGVSVETVVRIT
jgi:KaiC/GvpD/RAD55 family RecA-like ATPase